jgi:hypothetical protein
MNETKIQQENNFNIQTNATRYQHISDSNYEATKYAESLNPNMGMEADDCLQNICDRLILVSSVKWKSSNESVKSEPNVVSLPSYKPMLTIQFPNAIINAESPFIRDKMRNWRWMHSDLEIQVKVNATKFQQGALWIRYNPRADVLSETEVALTNHLRSITSFPGQLLNLADSDNIVLKFPYCCEYETFDLTNLDKRGSFGTVQIDVVSRLTGPTTAEEVNINVYAKFVNVKVYMPTVDDVLMNNLGGERYRFHAQGGSRSEESVEKTEGGVVSLPARAVSAVSDVIGLIPIPKIQMFSQSLGWLSRRVEDWALAHGLSKPEGVGSTVNILNMPARGMNHVEGLDTGVNLGIIQDNEIDPFHSNVGEDDEMSFKYIAQRPWLDSRFEWDVKDGRNTNVFSYSFSPIGSTGDENGNGRFTSCGQFLTLHHKVWHSSIKVTFKAVKTFAHSGRLQIMITPLPSGKVDLDSVDRSLAYIWDVRDENSMSFSVPWMSNMLWEDVSALLFRIDVVVLNELQAANNVSDSISILVFTSFGDDYEVAIPNYVPVSGFRIDRKESLSKTFIAMAGAPDNLTPLATEENYSLNRSNVGCISSIGEQISSVRQLIKRNVVDVSLGNELFKQVSEKKESLKVNSLPEQALPNNMFVMAVTPTLLGSFARIYRFWAGSMRYKMWVSSSGNFTISYADRVGPSTYFQRAALNPILEFTVPFYSHTRKKVVGYTARTNNNQITIINRKETGEVEDASVPIYVYSSAGDDFNYHFLVGPPVLQPQLPGT